MNLTNIRGLFHKLHPRKMTKFKAIKVDPGQRFGQLTVIHETARMVQPSGQSARSFMCRCDCGNEKRVRLAHLRHGRVMSCGCLGGEQHGMHGTKLHNSWRAMRMRCEWEGYSESYLYRGRGITICKEWRDSFIAFAKWSNKNGYVDGLTIDRIDNDQGYYPSNCRWVTQRENNNNRRCTFQVFYHGATLPFMEVMHNLELSRHAPAIRARIVRGWSADRAIDTPIRDGNYRRKNELGKAKP